MLRSVKLKPLAWRFVLTVPETLRSASAFFVDFFGMCSFLPPRGREERLFFISYFPVCSIIRVRGAHAAAILFYFPFSSLRPVGRSAAGARRASPGALRAPSARRAPLAGAFGARRPPGSHFARRGKKGVVANAHTAAKAPVLVRSPQLSAAGPRQYRVG